MYIQPDRQHRIRHQRSILRVVQQACSSAPTTSVLRYLEVVMRIFKTRSCYSSRLPSSRPRARQALDRVCAVPPATPTTEQWTTHTWQWKGHNINYAVCPSTGKVSILQLQVGASCSQLWCMQVAGCGEPVLLIHGFGVNYRQWRQTITAVSEDRKVWLLSLASVCTLMSQPVSPAATPWLLCRCMPSTCLGSADQTRL